MKKIIYFNQKRSDDETVKLINYMCHGWTSLTDHVFLGFILNVSDYNIGVDINNKNYIGCHYFYLDEPYDDHGNDINSCKKKPHILMFGGNDDISYFKRFIDEKLAIKYFENLEKITNDIIEQCYYFN